ncbi:MAG: hypothetical protein CBD29_06890 [Synechococcus sp. TMED169]|nr:MAG: hypothetical protein CBD29_06890 [Synechococcus sp. TMED169]
MSHGPGEGLQQPHPLRRPSLDKGFRAVAFWMFLGLIELESIAALRTKKPAPDLLAERALGLDLKSWSAKLNHVVQLPRAAGT